MPLTEEDKKHYYRLGYNTINKVVLGELQESDDLVIYGGRAINRQLPSYLRVSEKDWDIFATGDSAEDEARDMERALDERYGGNYFKVVPAKNPRTFRIVSKVSSKFVVDVTAPTEKVDFNTLKGINVATLDWHVRRIRKALRDKRNKYRWTKDKEVLQRIKLSGKLK